MLDAKDRKILSVLDKNSRSSFTQIAKQTGIGQETVRYRVNRLFEEGIITHCPTLINATMLGFTYYQLLFKLQNIDNSKRKELLDYLIGHPRTGWVAELEGNYDIVIIMPVRRQPELQAFIDDLYKRFSANIMRKTLSINLSGEFFARDYLLDRQRTIPKELPTYSYQGTVVLNEKEDQLCRLLSQNSRITAVEAAEKLGISADRVLLMLKRLEQEHIILSHGLTMDLEKIGRSHYKILLCVNNVSEEHIRQLVAHVRMDNRSIAVIRALSEYDYELDYELENVQQLKEVTMELTNRFSSIIRDYSVLRIVSMPKYTFYP